MQNGYSENNEDKSYVYGMILRALADGARQLCGK
jgi:hypothetical protein